VGRGGFGGGFFGSGFRFDFGLGSGSAGAALAAEPFVGTAFWAVALDRAVFLAPDGFLAGVFFGASFLGAAFLAELAAEVFLGATFFALVFLAAVFLAVVFFAEVFFGATFFALVFFAVPRVATFLEAAERDLDAAVFDVVDRALEALERDPPARPGVFLGALMGRGR
jgi:hypothetical protein